MEGYLKQNAVEWWKSPGRWWQGIVIQSSNFLCQLSLSFFWVSWGTQWCALWGSLLSPACLAYALLCYPSKLLAILIHVLLIPRPFDSARQSRNIPKSFIFLVLLFKFEVCYKEHVSSVHDENKPFKCEVCEHKSSRKRLEITYCICSRRKWAIQIWGLYLQFFSKEWLE